MISHSIRVAALTSVFAVMIFSAAPSADAASFEGPWSVLVVTKSGPCDQSYRYGVMIRGGHVSYLGGGNVSVSGRVSPSGQVRVSVSTGGQSAHGISRVVHGLELDKHVSEACGRLHWMGSIVFEGD